MKTIIGLIIALTLFFESFAQTRQSAGKLDINAAPRGIINEITELEPITTQGSYYLVNDWRACNITLKNGYEGFNDACKYNLETSNLEIKFKDQVKALDLRYINEFDLYTEGVGDTLFFENASNYMLDQIPLVGILEILVQGENKLIVQHKLKKQQANYIPALDVGEKSDTYLKNEKLYIAAGNRLGPINGKKGEWLKVLESQSEVVKQYAKENKLKFKKKEDLIQLIEFYNTL